MTDDEINAKYDAAATEAKVLVGPEWEVLSEAQYLGDRSAYWIDLRQADASGYWNTYDLADDVAQPRPGGWILYELDDDGDPTGREYTAPALAEVLKLAGLTKE